MPYSEIISTAFRTVWREKPLWLFGLMGTLLASLATGLSMGGMFAWQQSIMTQLMALTMTQQLDYLTVARILTVNLRGASSLWGVFACVTVLSYIVNLIMRAATVSEAGRALAGERSQAERGLGAGAGRAIYFFFLDLLWWLPVVVIFACVAGLALAGVAGLLSGVNSQNPYDITADVAGFFGLLLSSIACLGGLLLLYSILRGIFAPLMYQAVGLSADPQHRLGFGASLRHAGKLARAHLGAMLVFLVFLFGVGIAISLILRVFTIPLTGLWSLNMMSTIEDVANGVPPALPSALDRTSLYLIGLLFGLVSWLLTAFVQTFGLTLYAEVYRRLHAADAAAPIFRVGQHDAHHETPT